MKRSLFLAAALAHAQLAPVVGPRGVVNAFSQQPAPSSVAPGGLVWITGLNFGTASDTRVLVNGAVARVLSVEMNRIVAQLPPDTAPGLAEVVVQRGEARSRPAKVLVEPVAPSVCAVNDSGWGEAFTTVSGQAALLTASGLGAVFLTAHVGGLPSQAEGKARDDRPGEYEVRLSLPPRWQPGDVISLRAGGQTANRTTLRKISRPEVSFVRLPQGAPELTSLAGSDLRGNYLVASAARDDQGCSPTFLFDLAQPAATRLEPCLVTGNQISPSPVVAENEGAGLAALVGPAEGPAPAGVSSKVLVLHPERADPIIVQLPSAASALLSMGAEGITAMLAGDPVRQVTIDTRSGEVREAGPRAALPGAAALVLSVDLGEGLNQILSAPASSGDGVTGLVVGDQAERPTRMKFAIVNAQGEITSQSFPENWLALLGASAPAAVAGGPGGAGGPGLGAAARRASVIYHPLSSDFYVLARTATDSAHALLAFPKAGSGPRVVRFPDGWFVAACTSQLPLYSFQLSSRLAVPAAAQLETEFKSPCLATALLVAEPGAEAASLVSLSAQARFNVAAGSASSFNDYLYSGNGANPDAMVVFDGAMGSVSQLNLPAGMASFAATVPVSSMNVVVATATRQTQGDAGFVIFDLERSETRALTLPEGFSSASLVGVFPVTRKLVARATRSNDTGSQFLVYDLLSGEAAAVPNPQGVAWVGALSQATGPLPGGVPPGIPPGGGGGLPGGSPGTAAPAAGVQLANAKANFVAAVGLDSDRKQVGILAVRVP